MRRGGVRIEQQLPGHQGRLLVARLATEPGQVIEREALMDVLWPQERPSSDRLALRALVSKTRAVLGADVLETSGQTLWLALEDRDAVDITAVERASDRAEDQLLAGDAATALDTAAEAVLVADQPLMPGLEGEWLYEPRERLARLHSRLLGTVATACLTIGGDRLARGEYAARSLVARDPYRESAHRLLMEILAARGDVAEAVLTYEALRARLLTELGLIPSAPLRELHGSLINRT